MNVDAILAEEAGLHDWTLQHIGVIPLAAHFSKNSKAIAVITKDAVAALRVQDGSLVWRVKSEFADTYLASDADDSIVAIATREGNDDKTIRVSAYRMDDGRLLWSVVRMSAPGQISVSVTKGLNQVRVLIATPAEIVCLHGKNAKELWNTPATTIKNLAHNSEKEEDEAVNSESTETVKEEVVAEAAAAEHLSFRYDPSIDKLLITITEPTNKNEFRGIVLDTEKGAIIRTEKVEGPQCAAKEQEITFRLPEGDSGKIVAFCMDDDKSICSANPVAKTEEGACFGSCSKPEKTKSDVSIVLDKDGPSLLFLESKDKLVLHSGFVPALRGLPIALYVSPKDTGKRYALLVMEDGSWTLFDITNKNAGSAEPLWTREEALSQAERVEFFDLPTQDSTEMLSVLKEDAFSRIIHRSQLQFSEARRQFHLLMISLQNKIASYGFDASFLDFLTSSQVDTRDKVYDKKSGMLDDGELVQDDYNFEQRMVVSTHLGKIFGLRPSTRGAVDWSLWLGKSGVAKHQAMVRIKPAAKHTSEKTVLAFIRVFEESTNVFFIEPVTGKLLGENAFEFATIQSAVVDGKLLLFRYNKNDKLVAQFVDVPSRNSESSGDAASAAVVNPETNMTYFYTYKIGGKSIHGYALKNVENRNVAKTQPVWTISLSEGETIAAAAVRDPREVVHTPGRIFFSNRTIREKYLNKNLFAIATTMEDESAMVVYLIDGVTGRVIHSISHRKCSGPVHMVLTENSCIYHFRASNGMFRIGSIDLYRKENDWKTTEQSAYQRVPVDAYSTIFNFPYVVNAMSVTQTRQGNTLRLILLALETGQVYGLDKRILDPRRPMIDPELPDEEKKKLINPEDSLDGIHPYHPRLVVKPKKVITYNQTIEDINGVAVSRTNLESTCLVVAHGFDFFFARVYPAKRFDVLSTDFNYIMLLGTVAVLLITYFILSRVSAHRIASQAFRE